MEKEVESGKTRKKMEKGKQVKKNSFYIIKCSYNACLMYVYCSLLMNSTRKDLSSFVASLVLRRSFSSLRLENPGVYIIVKM